jgi:hypothetical protein
MRKGPFTTYQAIKANNKGSFNGIVMGPWAHGGWAGAEGKSLGNVSFDVKTGEYYRKIFCFRF